MAQELTLVSLVKERTSQIWQGVIDVIVPAHCLYCETAIDGTSCLCSRCWMDMLFIEAPVCRALGIPLAYDQGEGALSAAALASPPPWSRLRAAVGYNEVSSALVRAFKYHDRFEAGTLMARLMRRSAAELVDQADYIIPVPLYRWRLWGRRFNQSAFLAQALAKDHPKRFRSDFLIRHRATTPQVGLQASARHDNVKGAFSVPGGVKKNLAGRSILLVDDVITTGATASNCVKTLLAAGAGQVDIASFALVLARPQPHIPEET